MDYSDEYITLNVGGKIFQTTLSTLTSCRDSVLYKMFNKYEDSSLNYNKIQISRKDSNGAYLIDRDPEYFRVILNYLRSQPTDCRDLIIDNNVSIKGVLQEANYFQIDPLIDLLNKLEVQQPDFTRKEILIYKGTIKFSKKKLYNLDLSNIEFDKENFNGSFITNCIFNSCLFQRSSFFGVSGECSSFIKASVSNTIFSTSNLKNSNFTSCDLGHASFNNCDLTNATFDSSNCTGALFQRATIVNGSFKNSNLEHAKFQKAILKGCDFTNAQLQNCHFTSADLRDAKFNWNKSMQFSLFKKAKISQEQYDSIPLENKEKLGFKIIVDNEAFDNLKKLKKQQNNNNNNNNINSNLNNSNNSNVNNSNYSSVNNNNSNSNSNVNNNISNLNASNVGVNININNNNNLETNNSNNNNMSNNNHDTNNNNSSNIEVY